MESENCYTAVSELERVIFGEYSNACPTITMTIFHKNKEKLWITG